MIKKSPEFVQNGDLRGWPSQQAKNPFKPQIDDDSDIDYSQLQLSQSESLMDLAAFLSNSESPKKD